MDIDPSQATAVQAPFLEKVQDLVLLRYLGHRQRLQQFQNFSSILEIPASQLANHEWVAQYCRFVQLIHKS